MSYKYIGTPKYISFSECRENNYVFAPSKYTRFLPQNEWLFVPMSQICTESNTKIEIERKCEYNYTEIGDIDVSSGMVNHTHYYGMNLPSENPKHCQCGDILISTVRTYRGGVGMITEELSNHCCSPAILVIRNVAKIITKEYLLAILKTDFFVEQILGFQTRGMYPRLDSDAMNKVLIPIPKNVDTLKYVSILQRSFLNKYSLIRQRHANILQLIEKELTENQKSNKFNYHLPRLNEVKEIGRLDTSLYSNSFFYWNEIVKNYIGGHINLIERGFTYVRGTSLEQNFIKTRIDSDKYVKGFYELIIPTYISQYGYVEKSSFIGTPTILKNIKQGDIIFGGEGFGKGRTFVVVDDSKNIATNYHGIRIINTKHDFEESIFIRCFLAFWREKHMIDYIGVGGSGGHCAPSYFHLIETPLFSKAKQMKIAALYHNPQEYFTDDFTLDNFEGKDNEYNLTAGIYELDKTAKRLKDKLNKAIDDIVNDRDVKIDF